MPEISVIIPTNRIGGLDIIFESFKRQSFQDFELILVDAIYDKRKELVAEKAKLYGLQIKHIEPQNNTFPISNYCQSVNTALCAANGRIVFFTSDYMFIHKDVLLYHADFHRNSHMNSVFVMPIHAYLHEEKLSNNFPIHRQYGPSKEDGTKHNLMLASEEEYVNTRNKWSETYIEDLNNGLLDNLLWSIFDRQCNNEMVQDICNFDPKYTTLDTRYPSYITEVDPGLCCLKNDSMKLELMLNANGMNENMDGTHGFQDTDLARRLASIYGARFYACNMAPTSVFIQARWLLEPRKTPKGYNNFNIVNQVKFPLTNNTITRFKESK